MADLPHQAIRVYRGWRAMTLPVCPHCHQAVPPARPPADPGFDDENQVAVIAGRRVTFGPVQWRILTELRRSEGKLVGYGELIFEVYGPRAAPGALGALKRSIFIIQQKLQGSTWRVRRVHGRGVIAARAA